MWRVRSATWLRSRHFRWSASKAQAKGITRIELEVRADNERAIGLYKSLGFQQEAVKRHAMRFDGVYYDALQMSLLQSVA